MIHIATVHWESDRWVDVQLRHLARHMDLPYRVYGVLTGPAADHSERFFYAHTRPQSDRHPLNLNFLADVIVTQAADEDLVAFLDGDAFPVARLGQPITTMLERSPLVAIRRDENLEPHPHPSFCATTVGFWKEIQGDWRGLATEGSLIGAGGRILEALRERNLDWIPIRRTNVRNLHPVLFGVYGDLIYHHGAGFRKSITGADKRRAHASLKSGPTASAQKPDSEKRRLVELELEENERLDRLVFDKISEDEHFHRELFY